LTVAMEAVSKVLAEKGGAREVSTGGREKIT
jgi:hypothetical protein